MHTEDGVGLAAPQVGLTQRILVVDISPLEEEEKPQAYINTEILEYWGQSTEEEGCLSIPGVREDVTRHEGIRLKYNDIDGNEHIETFEGWKARVLQHEIDHLDGILFVDRISPIKRNVLISQKAIPHTY
ncbi:MAG: peptide deformylase, partial [Caldithrix sp.]|nr:peptide deformylase [Caldithrix sp.]